VTFESIQTSATEVHGGGAGSEVELVSLSGSAVVQVVRGDAHDADAMVADLHAARVIVTDRRILATEGDIEWSWLASDLEAFIHGAQDPWTVFVVPGIADFGVTVPADRVDEFRSALATFASVENRLQAKSAQANQTETITAPVLIVAAEADAEASALFESLAPLAAPLAAPLTAPLAAPAIAPTQAMPKAVATAQSTRWFGMRKRESQPASVAARPVVERAPLAGLHARDISAWFGTHQVLDRVSLDMAAGEVTALIGPSGCGKSTFLRILNRMHEMIPSASLAGEVLLDGHDIYDTNSKLTDARREIGMVFQKPNPFPAMSIYDNVVASLRLTGTKASVEMKDEIVQSCLSKAGLWNEVRDRLRQPGGGLSGGQQQRLCIARALAIKPRVLLMDEPCSALDPTSTRRIEETVMELASEVTIVIVTHNMQQAARVSNRCAFFLAEQGTPGVIVEHGPTDAMFGSPQDSRTNDYVSGRFG
jgi:phosphate transport system ATP-binding protein